MLVAHLAFAAAILTAAQRAESTGAFEARWRELKSTLSNEDLYRLMWAVPKGGDIHNHHEYSIRMRFWVEGAVKRGYYVRFRVGKCAGQKNALQWVSLRKESVRRLPACEQNDFAGATSLTEAQRREVDFRPDARR